SMQWVYADVGRIAVGYTINAPQNTHYTAILPTLLILDAQGNSYHATDAELSYRDNQLGYVQNFAPPTEQSSQPLDLLLVGKMVAYEGQKTTTIGPLSFHFSAPVVAGRKLPAPLTVEKNGFHLTLKQVIESPSLLSVEVCHDQSPNVNWGLDFTL